MASQVDLAEAQLLGFKHGQEGYSLISLIESMGLSKTEWAKIIVQSPGYLSKEDIKEIDEHFANQK